MDDAHTPSSEEKGLTMKGRRIASLVLFFLLLGLAGLSSALIEKKMGLLFLFLSSPSTPDFTLEEKRLMELKEGVVVVI